MTVQGIRTLETNKVRHGADSKVKDDVHSSCMECIDELCLVVDSVQWGSVTDSKFKGV